MYYIVFYYAWMLFSSFGALLITHDHWDDPQCIHTYTHAHACTMYMYIYLILYRHIHVHVYVHVHTCTCMFMKDIITTVVYQYGCMFIHGRVCSRCVSRAANVVVCISLC